MKPEKLQKRTLTDIVEDYRQLLLTIGENDGEVTAALMVELDDCGAEFSQKIDRVLFVAEEFFAAADGYKKRAKVLADHSKSLESEGQQLHQYAHKAMRALNIQKLSTPSFPSIYRRSNVGTRVTHEEQFLELYGEDKTFVEWVPKIYLEPIKKVLKGIAPDEEHPMKKVATLTETESLVVR